MIYWYLILTLSWVQPHQIIWPSFRMRSQGSGIPYEGCGPNDYILELGIAGGVPGGRLKSVRLMDCDKAREEVDGLRKRRRGRGE